MNNLQYPLHFRFRVTTLANDFVVKDANGSTIAYVRQKMFRFIEEISVFSDENRSNLLYTIRANQWLDFSASYLFTDASGREIGRVVRRGWASLWKARYEVMDEKRRQQFLIQEENPWIKVGDALFSEIPVIGALTGYVFNPSYKMMRTDGTLTLRMQKQPSLLGREFLVTQQSPINAGEEPRAMLSLMMMILLERRRG